MGYNSKKSALISTTIESRKFRIPSDLRRQPGYRPVSSKVGDHLRILLGVVVPILFVPFRYWTCETDQIIAEFMLNKGMHACLGFVLEDVCVCVREMGQADSAGSEQTRENCFWLVCCAHLTFDGTVFSSTHHQTWLGKGDQLQRNSHPKPGPPRKGALPSNTYLSPWSPFS
jgi:hypothetical protein